MIQPKRLGAILAAALLVGCAGDPDSDLGAGVQDVEVVGVNTLDMAEYMFPSCEVGSRTWRVRGEEFRTVPLGVRDGMAHYVFVKSPDGDGYEEWWVDRDWMRIRLDRTWAHCITDTGALCGPGADGNHIWCDVQCTRDNTVAACQRRWDRDASSRYNGLRPRAPWAATQYRSPGRPELAAPFVQRRLRLPVGGEVRFAAEMSFGGIDRESCAPCTTNFDTAPGATVRRAVTARRYREWRGFHDVVHLEVTAGPGNGENSYYARGLGLIGFGIGASVSVASELLERDTAARAACFEYTPASACAVGGNECRTEGGEHSLCGRFKQYWDQHGGLPVFGFPITAAQPELREDGRGHLTQWFERGRFEFHGANQAPYDVQLGRLGAERFSASHGGMDFWSTPRDEGPRPGCQWFAETRINVCDSVASVGAPGFLAYWREHGLEFDGRRGTSYPESLALFGLPLTQVRRERLSDGREYWVQWFERARFEWHPELPLRYRVLLGLLGNESRGRP